MRRGGLQGAKQEPGVLGARGTVALTQAAALKECMHCHIAWCCLATFLTTSDFALS